MPHSWPGLDMLRSFIRPQASPPRHQVHMAIWKSWPTMARQLGHTIRHWMRLHILGPFGLASLDGGWMYWRARIVATFVGVEVLLSGRVWRLL